MLDNPREKVPRAHTKDFFPYALKLSGNEERSRSGLRACDPTSGGNLAHYSWEEVYRAQEVSTSIEPEVFE